MRGWKRARMMDRSRCSTGRMRGVRSCSFSRHHGENTDFPQAKVNSVDNFVNYWRAVFFVLKCCRVSMLLDRCQDCRNVQENQPFMLQCVRPNCSPSAALRDSSRSLKHVHNCAVKVYRSSKNVLATHQKVGSLLAVWALSD